MIRMATIRQPIKYFIFSLLILAAVIAFASSASLAGSPPATAWEKQYGGSKDMTGSQVWQAEDNGFIVVGNGPDATNTGTNLYLTKFDWQGNQVWSKAIGGWTGNSVRQTSDGGYIATGTDGDFLYLVKTDKGGNVQWQKTFKSYTTPIGHAVMPADNGYIVVGQVAAGGTSEWDGYLLKTDASGNKQWDKVISTNGDYYGNEFYYSVWPTSDGGYILGGDVNFGYNPKPSLVKVDASGNIQWNKSYEDPEDIWANFGGTSCGVQQTRDGGFIYAGAHGDKTFLLKADANGNKQWAKNYDYPNSEARSVQQTWDDGYILAGKYNNPDQDAYKVMVIRTDANGNEQWHQMFGGVKYAEGWSVQQIGNGSYVAAGWTRTTADAIRNIELVQIARDMTPVPNARFVSDAIPSQMEANQAYQVSVTFTNDGTMPWTFQDGTTLGHSGDASKFGVTKNETIPIGTVLRPGQTLEVGFVMTAPGENGTYNPRFQWAWEGHQMFGGVDNKTVTVVNGTGPAAATPGPSSQATAQPTSSATPSSQASSAPSVAQPTKAKGGLPCLPSFALPLLAIGAVTVSWAISRKRGNK